MRDACVVLKELSADDQARLEAQMRKKAWRDEMDRLDGAIEKGRQEGRNQRDIENVKNMYSKGLSITQIADYLDMNVNAVEKILSIQ